MIDHVEAFPTRSKRSMSINVFVFRDIRFFFTNRCGCIVMTRNKYVTTLQSERAAISLLKNKYDFCSVLSTGGKSAEKL